MLPVILGNAALRLATGTIYLSDNTMMEVYLSTPVAIVLNSRFEGIWAVRLVICIAVQLVLGGLAFRRACTVLDQASRAVVVWKPGGENQRDEVSATKSRRGQPYSWTWSPIRDGWNPMFVCDFRHSGLFSTFTPLRSVFLVLGVIICNVIFGWAFSVHGQVAVRSTDKMMMMIGWTGAVGGVCLLGGVMSGATAFVRELERNTKDLLQLTLLTPRQLVTGKLGVTWMHTLMVFAVGMAAILPILRAAIQVQGVWQILAAGIVTMTVCIAGASSLGVMMSVLCRHSSTAAPCAVLASLAYFVGPLPVVWVGTVMMGLDDPPTALANASLFLSPVLGLFLCLKGAGSIALNVRLWAGHLVFHVVLICILVKCTAWMLEHRWYRLETEKE